MSREGDNASSPVIFARDEYLTYQNVRTEAEKGKEKGSYLELINE